MTLFRNFFSCVRGHRSHRHRRAHIPHHVPIKIKLGVPLARMCHESHLAAPLLRLVTFLAREGAHANDLFRRPGNMSQVMAIIKLLSQGKVVQWGGYNLYTAANVAKKFLLSIPGGLFGRRGEEVLLSTADLSEEDRTEQFISLVRDMDPASRELTIILFGILFRMVNHAVATTSVPSNSPTEFCPPTPPPSPVQHHMHQQHQHPTNQPLHQIQHQHPTNQPLHPLILTSSSSSSTSSLSFAANRQAILSEAVAKSVAGSLFHTCRESPEKVEEAVPILQSLILAFPSFDVEFIDFFDQAVNKLSLSNSSTGSSRELSISGPSKITRKPSGIAASIEMWTENWGKSVSQRSSLKECSLINPKIAGLSQQALQHQQHLTRTPHPPQPPPIPSIKITSPSTSLSPSQVSLQHTNDSPIQTPIHTEPINPAPTKIRPPQDRLKSMKRRQMANLQRRSDWFLASTESPQIVFIPQQNVISVTVTCGGSSICLGQTTTTFANTTTATTNICCCCYHQTTTSLTVTANVRCGNNGTGYCAATTTSGPDLLQWALSPSSTDRLHYGDDEEEEGDDVSSYQATSLYSVEHHSPSILTNTELLFRNQERELHHLDDVIDEDGDENEPAPNSVPLTRRMLPSRSSTSSRKNSRTVAETLVDSFRPMDEELTLVVRHYQEDEEEEEEEEDDDDDDELVDTQSNYY